MRNKKSNNGFTLVELLVTIMIILILALIIIARVPQFLDRSREAKTRDHLVNLRAAIHAYYGANQGMWPIALDDQSRIAGGQILPPFIPTYMPNIPPARLRKNAENTTYTNSGTVTVVNTGPRGLITITEITNQGGWIYSSSSGDLRINSSDEDSKKELVYSLYGHEE